jgi:hypothetical protein
MQHLNIKEVAKTSVAVSFATGKKGVAHCERVLAAFSLTHDVYFVMTSNNSSKCKRAGLLLCVGILGFQTILLNYCNLLAAEAQKPLPPFEDVVKAVRQSLAGQADYKDGDLLTQGMVEPLFEPLAKMGFVVPDRQDILSQVPADCDLLVSMLHSPDGMKFMRQSSGYPDAYDRLDHMLRLPLGEQTVRDLIRGPDGYKMIQYMTTAPGGKNLGLELSRDPGGAGFNEPTGRIYTAKMLLDRLQQSHAEARKKVAATESAAPN